MQTGHLAKQYIRHRTTNLRNWWPYLLLNNLPAITAPESSLSHWLIAFTYLNKPIQICHSPAAAGYAVKSKRVILISKLLDCPHADHRKSQQSASRLCTPHHRSGSVHSRLPRPDQPKKIRCCDRQKTVFRSDQDREAWIVSTGMFSCIRIRRSYDLAESTMLAT